MSRIALFSRPSVDRRGYGEVIIETPGTHTFSLPAEVTSFCAVAIGSGGSGGSLTWTIGDPATELYVDVIAGGGGALAYVNNVQISSGQSILAILASGNSSSLSANGSVILRAAPGSSKASWDGIGPIGGKASDCIGDAAFSGGFGGAARAQYSYQYADWSFPAPYVGGVAGGGAAGYAGDGGDGYGSGGDNFLGNIAGVYNQSGSGGGGGGGTGGGSAIFNSQNYISSPPGANGGGVGIFGQGESGGPGQPGSGGSGMNYGGGGGHRGDSFLSGEELSSGSQWISYANNRGPGVIRIIYGTGRAFPSTNTGQFGNVVIL